MHNSSTLDSTVDTGADAHLEDKAIDQLEKYIDMAPEAIPQTINDKPQWTAAEQVFEETGEPFVVDEKGKVDMNGFAVAKAFTHTRVLNFDATTKQFNGYNSQSGLWVPETAEQTHQEMTQFLKALGKEKGHDEFIKRQKEGTITSLIKFAKANGVSPTVTDTSSLFHVANGILDFSDGTPTLLPHSVKYPFRKSSRITYNTDAKCERFLNELLEPALAKEDQELLQTLFGGMLLGENQAQKILLIRGIGGSGKSTLVSVIEKVLGEHKVAYLRAKNLNGRFETAGFIGRSVLVGKDVPGDTLSENGARLLKALTGGDLMEGEIKFQQHRPQLKGNFHVVVVSNNNLRIALDGDESAWMRRLVTVDFNREVPKKAVVDFADVLVTDEASGILNWLIEGAMRYQQQLADGGRIVLTETQRTRVYNLLYNSDSVRAFIEQQLKAMPGADVSSNELLTAYITTCKANGWQPVAEKKFLETVADEILKRHNVHRRNDILRNGGPVRGYKGITIV